MWQSRAGLAHVDLAWPSTVLPASCLRSILKFQPEVLQPVDIVEHQVDMAKRSKTDVEGAAAIEKEAKKQKKEKSKAKAGADGKVPAAIAVAAPATFSLFGGKSNPELDDVFNKGVRLGDEELLGAMLIVRPPSRWRHQCSQSLAPRESSRSPSRR